MLKKLQTVQGHLDKLYSTLVENDIEYLIQEEPECFYYYIRLYGDLPSAVKDSDFIIRLPTCVNVSDAAREITQMFPNIQRQGLGTEPKRDNLENGEAYYQITVVSSADSA